MRSWRERCCIRSAWSPDGGSPPTRSNDESNWVCFRLPGATWNACNRFWPCSHGSWTSRLRREHSADCSIVRCCRRRSRGSRFTAIDLMLSPTGVHCRPSPANTFTARATSPVQRPLRLGAGGAGGEEGTGPAGSIHEGDSPRRVRNELVADTPDREQMSRTARFLLDVPAQPHDEVVDGARVGIFAHAPDVLEHGLARD